MGVTTSIIVQFLTIENGPNDFAEFDANFNPKMEQREWQWKVIHSLFGAKGSSPAADKCHAEKKKNVKLNVMVKDKCRGLVFQLPDPSCAAAINYELELPYKHDIPVVIFCRNAEGADPGDIDVGVRGRLSPALRTTRLKVIAYTGASIPAELRNQGMDWIASSLKLPADEEEYPDETLSLVVVGSAHVGKTSLLQRYVNDEFNPKQGPTMGIDKFTVRKALRLPGRTRDQNFILDMWDTAGEQRYRTVTLAFYNCAHGCVSSAPAIPRSFFRCPLCHGVGAFHELFFC